MRRYYWLLAWVLIWLNLFTGTVWAVTTGPSELPPQVVGKAAILIDARTGAVLYEKQIHQPLPPASTTKILTVLVALEKGNLKQKVRTSKAATLEDGSSIWLLEGEEMTLEDLLYAVLLNSANDASLVVAETIGGSKEGFARMMNEKARQLGAKNSNFLNPNGLPEEGHYTTAYDLALITKGALDNPKFREIAATKVREIPRQQPAALNRLINHNKLLWSYEGANGVKTGYTVEAQQCLVASASRGDREFISVVLGSQGQNIWSDSIKLLDYGFNNFKIMPLIKVGERVTEVEVNDGITKLQVISGEDLSWTTSIQEKRKPSGRLVLSGNLAAPITKGKKVGTMIYSLDGQEVGQVRLFAAKQVEENKTIENLIKGGLLVLSLLVVPVMIRQRQLHRRREMRRLARRSRRNY
ncbi:MAG: D-alanyl-D-alanine carboxypeptidase [Clostridia bacterium]|nr:D-alanyl-D-alanine carboxypeptidase [Clostridia bacterium]